LVCTSSFEGNKGLHNPIAIKPQQFVSPSGGMDRDGTLRDRDSPPTLKPSPSLLPDPRRVLSHFYGLPNLIHMRKQMAKPYSYGLHHASPQILFFLRCLFFPLSSLQGKHFLDHGYRLVLDIAVFQRAFEEKKKQKKNPSCLRIRKRSPTPAPFLTPLPPLAFLEGLGALLLLYFCLVETVIFFLFLFYSSLFFAVAPNVPASKGHSR